MAVLPDPLKVKIDLDATETVNKLVDVGIVGVRGPVESAAGLLTDIIEVVRGPFKLARLGTLAALAKAVKRLREEQDVTANHSLSPPATQLVLERASFATENCLRELWAQLVVNRQAGMTFDDYMFDLLSRLNGEDVAYLLALQEHAKKQKELREEAQSHLRAKEHEQHWKKLEASEKLLGEWDETPKLRGLGLVEPLKQTLVDIDKPDSGSGVYRREVPPDYVGKTREEIRGYVLSDLGWIFLDAVQVPAPRES